MFTIGRPPFKQYVLIHCSCGLQISQFRHNGVTSEQRDTNVLKYIEKYDKVEFLNNTRLTINSPKSQKKIGMPLSFPTCCKSLALITN